MAFRGVAYSCEPQERLVRAATAQLATSNGILMSSVDLSARPGPFPAGTTDCLRGTRSRQWFPSLLHSQQRYTSSSHGCFTVLAAILFLEFASLNNTWYRADSPTFSPFARYVNTFSANRVDIPREDTNGDVHAANLDLLLLGVPLFLCFLLWFCFFILFLFLRFLSYSFC